MGIGDNPLYFCERGYYLEHERNMLLAFQNAEFNFQPNVKSPDESIKFLQQKCGVSETQARLRVKNNDLLILQYIRGIPLATRTGYYLDYEVNICSDNDVLREILLALEDLKTKLNEANKKNLLHNDPMPDNIILTLDESNNIVAKLVDFEIAQDLKESSPEYVCNTVRELYKERDVPINYQTNKYKRNLDQYLIDESIKIVKEFLNHNNLIQPLERFYGVDNFPRKSNNFDIGKVIYYNIAQSEIGSISGMSQEDTYNQSGNFGIGHMSGGEIQKGAKVAGVINEAEQQNLAEAAEEIQQLLKQLSNTYPTNTTAEQMIVAAKAVEQIESNLTLKQKAINAVKEGGIAAFEKAIDNPAGAFIAGAIKGWQEVKAE